MSSQPASPHHLAATLRALQSRVLVSGALVLSATVTLAVWGPALDIPGLPTDTRSWAAGALLAGGLLMLALHALMLRPLARLQRRALSVRAAGPANPPPTAVAVQAPAAVPALVPAPVPLAEPGPAPDPARDPLTGLLTAAAFHARLAQWLQCAPAGQPASLLLIDLDRFKRINEAAGRRAGDGVLRRAAALLQTHVREGDALARLDGDTYAMLLPGCVAAVALQMGERLRAALATLGVDHAGHHLGVGATVGVAELGRSASAPADHTAEAWMARAQAAWYEAKYAGHGGVRLATQAAGVPVVVPVSAPVSVSVTA